jgi:hypothetical protein
MSCESKLRFEGLKWAAEQFSVTYPYPTEEYIENIAMPCRNDFDRGVMDYISYRKANWESINGAVGGSLYRHMKTYKDL